MGVYFRSVRTAPRSWYHSLRRRWQTAPPANQPPSVRKDLHLDRLEATSLAGDDLTTPPRSVAFLDELLKNPLQLGEPVAAFGAKVDLKDGRIVRLCPKFHHNLSVESLKTTYRIYRKSPRARLYSLIAIDGPLRGKRFAPPGLQQVYLAADSAEVCLRLVQKPAPTNSARIPQVALRLRCLDLYFNDINYGDGGYEGWVSWITRRLRALSEATGWISTTGCGLITRPPRRPGIFGSRRHRCRSHTVEVSARPLIVFFLKPFKAILAESVRQEAHIISTTPIELGWVEPFPSACWSADRPSHTGTDCAKRWDVVRVILGDDLAEERDCGTLLCRKRYRLVE